MSLKNKTILITRRKEQSAEFVDEIERRGGRVFILPAIRILDPESWEPCDLAIEHLHSYDGVLFTSANAVEKFFQRCREKRADISRLALKQVWAVGRKTASAIAEEGIRAVSVPGVSSARDLARAMVAGDVRGKKYLLPRSNIGREDLVDELQRHGAAVETVVFYRTVPPPAEDMTLAARQMLDGCIDVLAFASPSAVRNFFAMLPADVRDAARVKMKVAVIGPTTDQAVKELGWTSDIVASETTDGGFADAIEHYYAAHP